MKTKALTLTAIILVFLLSCNAQENDKRFGFEFSTGASVATKKLGGSTLNPGVGFEGIFHYRVLPHAGIYAGWGWNKFGADESVFGNNIDFEETGYVFGVQFKHPIGERKTSIYFRAGGLYNHIEVENDGDITHNSGHGLGWQAAAGSIGVDLVNYASHSGNA